LTPSRKQRFKGIYKWKKVFVDRGYALWPCTLGLGGSQVAKRLSSRRLVKIVRIEL